MMDLQSQRAEVSGPSDVWQQNITFDDDMFIGNERRREKNLGLKRGKTTTGMQGRKPWMVTLHWISLDTNSISSKMRIR